EICFVKSELTSDYSLEIIKFVRGCHPLKAELIIEDHSLPKQGLFLVELSKFVDAIHIKQVKWRTAAVPQAQFNGMALPQGYVHR
ncbi:hypothetical protein PFISCL1PPCAC_692, partial [Pristionchus fissidentatus]